MHTLKKSAILGAGALGFALLLIGGTGSTTRPAPHRPAAAAHAPSTGR